MYSKEFAYLFVWGSALLTVFSIAFLAYTSKGGFKPVHIIAMIAVIGGVATLYKELGSSEKTDAIRATGENTNKRVIELEGQNEALQAKADKQAEIIHSNDLSQKEAQRELNTKSERIIALQDSQSIEQQKLNAKSEKIIALGDEHKSTLLENVRLSKELAEASKRAEEQTQEKLDNILGKNSYCYLKIEIPRNKNAALLTVHNSGKFQLDNLEISIVNTDEEFARYYDKSVNYPDDDDNYHRFPDAYVKKIPFLKTGQTVPLGFMKVVRRPQKSFNVFFKTNKNIWYQRILLRDLDHYLPASSIPSDIRYIFQSISQVYIVNYTRPNSVIYHFEDTLEVVGRVASPDDESFKREPASFFPLMRDEKPPFKEIGASELHWDGERLLRTPPILPNATGRR